MFPTAIQMKGKPKKDQSVKFSRNRKLYEITFKNVEQLNHLFGEGWDIVYNKSSVGFCCPTITFRLRETTLISHKTKLTDDLEDGEEVHQVGKNIFTCVSISFFRSSESRWSIEKNDLTGEYTESNYLQEIRRKQKISRKLAKRRVLNYKK